MACDAVWAEVATVYAERLDSLLAALALFGSVARGVALAEAHVRRRPRKAADPARRQRNG